jgi:hypothetical protein
MTKLDFNEECSMKEFFPSSDELECAAANSHNLACDLTELLKLRRAVQGAEVAMRNNTVLRSRAALPLARPR